MQWKTKENTIDGSRKKKMNWEMRMESMKMGLEQNQNRVMRTGASEQDQIPYEPFSETYTVWLPRFEEDSTT